MNFDETLNLRVSDRSFNDEEISDDVIRYILLSAQKAPVAKGKYENYVLTVVRGERLKMLRNGKDFSQYCNIFYNSTLVIFLSTIDYSRPELSNQDAGCIIENMQLACTNIGLGSVYVYSGSKPANSINEYRDILGYTKNEFCLACIAVGHPNIKEFPKQHLIKVRGL